MHSTLEIFKVDVNAGFTKLGSIDSTPLIQKTPLGYCGGYFQPSVRRGVFLENFVYAVSYAGVVVRDSAQPSAPPAPRSPSRRRSLNPGYGPVCPPIPGPVPVTTPRLRFRLLPSSRTTERETGIDPARPRCSRGLASFDAKSGQETAGVHDPLRVEALFRGDEGALVERRAFLYPPRPGKAADRVVVGHRPFVREDRIGRGGLDCLPLLELGRCSAGSDEGVVGRRSIRIHVREASHAQMPPAAGMLHGGFDGAP